MKTYEEIFSKIREEMGAKLEFYIDDSSSMGIVTLPFKDRLGDPFIIRIGENDGHLILDDAGTIQNTLFVMSKTVGGLRASRLANALIRSFDARFDRVEGIIEMVSDYDEVVSKILHFVKLLVTTDTMLVEIGKEEKELARPYRRSLGPRASHRIRTSLKPLIDAKKVSHRVTVGGLTVPDWLVDFTYEPKLKRLAMEVELVVLISVDLAVQDPVIKATYAYSRAMDIKAAHSKYDILIAYDTHGQNSASASGANFIKEHQVHDKAYRAIDLSKKENFSELILSINRETGMPLTA